MDGLWEIDGVADPRFPRRGPQALILGANTYYLARFFPEKLHENERNWTDGKGVSMAPPWNHEWDGWPDVN